MVIIALLVLGLCLGSFVNAYIWRLHGQEELRGRIDELEYEIEQLEAQKGKSAGIRARQKQITVHRAAVRELSIWRGRSRCTHCGHELAAVDLIPVVSYLWLGRKCRYCGKPIDDTPVAELLTPALFIISYVFWPAALHGGQLVEFAAWMVCVAGFTALVLYDLRWKLLPNRIILPLIAVATASIIVQTAFFKAGDQLAARAFWGILTAAGIFRVLYEISSYLMSIGKAAGAWIGFGDVRLGVLLGLLLGGPANGLLLLFLASLLGTLVSIPLLVTGRATRTSHIPYGPFLIAAAVIIKLWGAVLTTLYGRLLL